MIGMLCALQIMHILWYGLFIQMGLTFFMTGKAEDIQQKIVATKPTATPAGGKKSN